METVTYENNEQFKMAFESKVHNIKFYIPSENSKYHLSRYVAACAQDIYSGAGATKEFIRGMAEQVLAWCNDAKMQELRTNVGTMMNNLLYRLQYPVDEFCMLRMGSILTFVENEDPNSVNDFWTRRKMDFATGNKEEGIIPDGDLYNFFLIMGIQLTPSYKGSQDILSDTKYLTRRREMLQSFSSNQSPKG